MADELVFSDEAEADDLHFGHGHIALSAALAAAPITVMLMGDSVTWGGGSGVTTAAGFRPEFWRYLRALRRDNVRLLGTLQEGRAGYFLLGDQHHEGHTGFRIEQIDAATYLASAGIPDFLFLMIGSNNISAGESGATCLTRLQTLLNIIRTAAPNTRVLVSSIPPWVSPAASFAAKETQREAYNAGIAAVCAGMGPNFQFIDACGGLSPASIGSDGIHPNKQGYSVIARYYARTLDRLLTTPRGIAHPRDFVSRFHQASFQMSANADKIAIPYGAGLKPAQTGSYSVGLWLRPSSLADGFWTLAQYGTVYTAGGYLLVVNTASSRPEIWVYSHSNAGPQLTTSTQIGMLFVNKWHRIWFAYDAPAQELRLYVTREGGIGHLAAVATGVGVTVPCTETAQTTLGAAIGGGFNAQPGLYDGFVVCNNYAVTLADVEADYYDAILPAATTASYTLAEGTGTTVIDANGTAGPNGSTSGGAWVAAGTNPKPFDEP